MGLVNNNSGFLSGLFGASKPASPEAPSKTVSQKVSSLRQFVTTPAKKAFSLFGKSNVKVVETSGKKTSIDKTALQKQAEHINAVKEGKIWASKNVMKPLGTSQNSVYKLNNSQGSEASIFFKQGKKEDQSSGIMEKMMWDMAVIMGDSHQFVATSQTNLSTPQGDMAGGAQTAQKGRLLRDLIDKKETASLSRSNILKASLTTMVYGMYDAHASNLLVDDKTGEIRFFDNTKNFPPHE